MDIICATFAVESRDSPVLLARSSTLPSACARLRLLVIGMQMTVRIWLRFRASP